MIYGATARPPLQFRVLVNPTNFLRAKPIFAAHNEFCSCFMAAYSCMQVAGGLLADSPGFNQPSLDDLNVASLSDCFPEVRERAERCVWHFHRIL